VAMGHLVRGFESRHSRRLKVTGILGFWGK
jgi:hypothetical protein